jgi:hypothetical protein
MLFCANFIVPFFILLELITLLRGLLELFNGLLHLVNQSVEISLGVLFKVLQDVGHVLTTQVEERLFQKT